VGSKGKKRFKGPRAPKGGGSMMQQFEDLQNQMVQAQEALASETVIASVGGGMVTVEMTGNQELRAITINPEAVDPDDVEMLQDLIVAAFKEAQAKSQELASQKLGPLAGGLDVAGLF